MSAEDWTERAVELLRTKWAAGESSGRIVKALAQIGVKKTRSAVIGKLHRLGMTGRGRMVDRRVYRRKPASERVKPQAYRPRHTAADPVERSSIAVELRPASFRHAPARAPAKGITAVRFVDRRPDQCAMFCEGEEGALGFVCGAAIAVRQWCESCARLAYQPSGEGEKRRKAA